MYGCYRRRLALVLHLHITLGCKTQQHLRCIILAYTPHNPSLHTPWPLRLPFHVHAGAFVSGNDVLTWAGNNTAKLGLNGGPAGVECWTLVSSNAYGQANKVPQEAIPPDVADKVKGLRGCCFHCSVRSLRFL